MSKDYAGAIYNEELRFTVVDGLNFSTAARAEFLLTLSQGDQVFSSGDDDLYFSP